MREKAKLDGGTKTRLSSREELERLFERHFGQAWDASTREQVLSAVRIRKDGFLVLREIERVVAGATALMRMLDGVPPPGKEPRSVFGGDRKRSQGFLMVWAFEEGLVPFASDPVSVSPRMLAVVSMLMGYEPDSLKEGVFQRAEERMEKTRQRYRRGRAPTTPETKQLVAQADALRALEGPARQALDTLMQMFGGTIHQSESVPVGTVSQS